MGSIFHFTILSLLLLTSRITYGDHIFEIKSIDDLNPDSLSATLLIKFTDTSFYPSMSLPYIKDVSVIYYRQTIYLKIWYIKNI